MIKSSSSNKMIGTAPEQSDHPDVVGDPQYPAEHVGLLEVRPSFWRGVQSCFDASLNLVAACVFLSSS